MSEICGAKHAKPQIPDEEWKCPKCDITADHETGGFVIEDPDGEASPECPLLHDHDGVCCSNCGYGASGKSLAKLVAKRRNLVPCGSCKGTGFVVGAEPREGKGR